MNIDWTWTSVILALIWAVFFAGILHYIVWKQLFFTTRKQPPSFYGWPIFGYIPYFRKAPPHVISKELADRYGPVIRLRIGFTTAYIVNGDEAIREMLKQDATLGRPRDNVFALFSSVDPLAIMQGERWKKHRRFALHTLRNIGFGKTAIMERHIQEELYELFEEIDAQKSQPYDPRIVLVPSMSNNIATLIFGKRRSFKDPMRIHLNNLLLDFLKNFQTVQIISFFPQLLRLMIVFKLPPINTFTENFEKLIEHVKDDIAEHSVERHEEPRDFLGYYLQAMKDDPDFTMRTLLGASVNLFGAGSNTVRTTIEGLLQLCAVHQDVQENVLQEIKKVIGFDRHVCWEDHKNMPYTRAVIIERHRLMSIVPFGVPRATMTDTTICGYHVPKGATVIYNLHSIDKDENMWKNADTFDPTRFLNDNGQLNGQEVKVIPFSIGKRACPGETLADLEVFLYFVALLQRYHIKVPEGKTIVFNRSASIINEPVAQQLRFVPRF